MRSEISVEEARVRVPAAKARIPVTVLGATGSVGQRMVALLAGHPWFDLVCVAASERSAGKPYGEAARWLLPAAPPKAALGLKVESCDRPAPTRLVFSALDAQVAGEAEELQARAGRVVVSNARNHRMRRDVPLVVPEVNPEHLELAALQAYGGGAIYTNPNCSTIGLVIALKPLLDRFGLDALSVVTLQALSGAGYPGVSSLDIADNVVPFIGGEEGKLETEPRKILGRLAGREVLPAAFSASATCTRVPVVDGHTECVSVRLGREAEAAEILSAWREYRNPIAELRLPSAPDPLIVVRDEEDRPQPRLDRDAGGGMTVNIGRLRRCPVMGWKFVLLSHNTIRGAAGGTLLLAELIAAKGLTA
jgi:aspartate-semialdehyde dehydrogenase